MGGIVVKKATLVPAVKILSCTVGRGRTHKTCSVEVEICKLQDANRCKRLACFPKSCGIGLFGSDSRENQVPSLRRVEAQSVQAPEWRSG